MISRATGLAGEEVLRLCKALERISWHTRRSPESGGPRFEPHRRSALQKMENQKMRGPGVYYVTELCGPCLRDAYYGCLIPWEQPLQALRIFDSGNLIEAYWLNILKETPGYTVLATQVPAYLGSMSAGNQLRFMEELTRWSSTSTSLWVHEIKSIKSTYYLNGEAKKEHFSQANFYCHALGVTNAEVDYLDKINMLQGEGPIDQQIRIQPSCREFEGLIDRCRSLHESVRERRLPEKAPLDCWKCKTDRWVGATASTRISATRIRLQNLTLKAREAWICDCSKYQKRRQRRNNHWFD